MWNQPLEQCLAFARVEVVPVPHVTATGCAVAAVNNEATMRAQIPRIKEHHSDELCFSGGSSHAVDFYVDAVVGVTVLVRFSADNFVKPVINSDGTILRE